jgi:hypothetical protein
MKTFVNLWDAYVKFVCKPSRIRGNVWAKKVTSLDLSQSSGYAFVGDFLTFRAHQKHMSEEDIEKNDILIFYVDCGSIRHHTATVSFCVVEDITERSIKLKEIKTFLGYDWAKQALLDKELISFISEKLNIDVNKRKAETLLKEVVKLVGKERAIELIRSLEDENQNEGDENDKSI